MWDDQRPLLEELFLAVRYWTFGRIRQPQPLTRVRLEASSICQLHCPACPQECDELDSTIGKGFLKLNDFALFLEKNPSIKEIELSNWGEPFLNPDLAVLIEHAFKKGVTLTAINGSNFNTVPDTLLEAFVRYRFHTIVISIDGATPETYRQYRIGGDLNAVIANIKKLNELKKRFHSPFPLLRWKFITFPHSTHELSAARQKARELGMTFQIETPWDSSPGGADPSGTSCHRLLWGMISQTNLCRDLFFMPQINWDGKLLGCCVNKSRSFGNVFQDGLSACLSDPAYQTFLSMVRGTCPPDADMPCLRCSAYPLIRRFQYPARIARIIRWFFRGRTQSTDPLPPS